MPGKHPPCHCNLASDDADHNTHQYHKYHPEYNHVNADRRAITNGRHFVRLIYKY